jgi:uncharacterized protein (DUF1330 family)
MPAYAIATLQVSDWEWLHEYGPKAAALIAKHGGRYLVRGGEMQRLEGEAELPSALVILEFPSLDAARAFHADPEYAPLIALRDAHAATEFVLVEGVGPEWR